MKLKENLEETRTSVAVCLWKIFFNSSNNGVILLNQITSKNLGLSFQIQDLKKKKKRHFSKELFRLTSLIDRTTDNVGRSLCILLVRPQNFTIFTKGKWCPT